MPDTMQKDVTYLEGIGPAAATALESVSILTVGDLIRASAEAIRDGSGGLASIETARRWRAMALLVEIEGVDHQLAEALADDGVLSAEQVRFRTAVHLHDVFTEAEAAGKIPEVPAMETVHAMLLDATILDLTGSLNGTVRDEDGEPVEGAAVRIGGLEWTTDARGRFRASRIALGQPQEIVIEHADFETLVYANPPFLVDDAIIGVEVFTLEPALEDDVELLESRLCEYAGDALPPITHHSMTTRSMEPGTLRENDVLVMHRYYSGDEDVQLSSKYLQYEDGRFFVLNWRVPKSQLPADAELKQSFLYRNETFKRMAMSPHQLRHLQAMRRLRQTMAGSPNPVTPMEIDAAIAMRAEMLIEDL